MQWLVLSVYLSIVCNIYVYSSLHVGKEFLYGLGTPANPSKHSPSNELEAVAELHLRPPADHPVALAVQAKAAHWRRHSWNHYWGHSHTSRYSMRNNLK